MLEFSVTRFVHPLAAMNGLLAVAVGSDLYCSVASSITAVRIFKIDAVAVRVFNHLPPN